MRHIYDRWGVSVVWIYLHQRFPVPRLLCSTLSGREGIETNKKESNGVGCEDIPKVFVDVSGPVGCCMDGGVVAI